MGKKVVLFLTCFIAVVMLVLTPKTGDAAMLRPSPEFGPNEFGQVLDDFMLKSKFNLGKFYTVESSSSYNGTTTHTIQRANAIKGGTGLEVRVNSKTGLITGVKFKFFIPGGISDTGVETLYNSWGLQVKQRYGNPTEEGQTSLEFPYGKFYEEGKYKYSIDSLRITPTGQPTRLIKSTGFFVVNIEAF